MVLASAFGTIAIAAPILLFRYFEIDPQVVQRAGYPALFLFGVIGGVTIFLPIPMLPLVFAGASVLNPFYVAIAAAGGMTLGMAITYFVGALGTRALSRATEHQPDKGAFMRWWGRATRWYRRSGGVASFMLAALPNPVYDFAGIIAGSIRVPFRQFCVGTFAGKSTQTVAVALAGFYAAGRIPGLG